MLFRKRNGATEAAQRAQKHSGHRTSEAGGSAEGNDPFKAVPVTALNVEASEDAEGRVHLRMALEEKSGIKEYLARKFGFRRAVMANLDERGSFFWKKINGARDLAAIEKEVRRQFDLNEEDSRRATILFVKMLMLRGLIYLKVPKAQ